jgi:hypothetical protein
MLKKLIALLVVVQFLAACSGSAPAEVVSTTPTASTAATSTATPTITLTPTITATASLTPTATEAEVDLGPSQFPEGVDPLTGLVVDDAALLDRRPVAVKIQLFPRYGRPPFGLSSADIVWEYYHNNGITRLHAIFYGQNAEEIGPIRSARLPDNDLIQMYKSIFAYGSADYRINQRLLNAPYAPYLVLEGALSECPPTAEKPMCRFEPAGQDLLLSGTQELTDYINNKNLDNTAQNLEGMRFTSQTPPGGKPAAAASLRYSADSYARWDYDPDTGLYVRSQDAALDNGTSGETYEVLTDRLTEQPITTANVVVLAADHSYFYKSGNSEIIEIKLTGTGSAYVFRDGLMYDVTWSRLTPEALVNLYDTNGDPFPLKPGNTWYQVMGTTSGRSTPELGTFRWEFKIP